MLVQSSSLSHRVTEKRAARISPCHAPSGYSLGKLGQESDDNLVVHALQKELAIWGKVSRSAGGDITNRI